MGNVIFQKSNFMYYYTNVNPGSEHFYLFGVNNNLQETASCSSTSVFQLQFLFADIVVMVIINRGKVSI